MSKQTPLYQVHQVAGAKLVDFAGWDMPLHYGSQIDEHHQVRNDAGLFDVSHMGVVDIEGPDAADYLRYLLANNVDRLVDGKALYTCMLNEQGGVIDDLIVYKLNNETFRLVINAGTRDDDISWMKKQQSSFDVKLTERTDLAMFAIQGPNADKIMEKWLSADQFQALTALKPFHFTRIDSCFIARTGYTGENGYEIILPADEIAAVWNTLQLSGAKPCGLGARDTLRLEAGLNLYGSDMDETTTPLESNLSWTVVMDPEDRNFIGRKALEKQKKTGIQSRLVGLVLEGAGIMRNKMKVRFEGNGEGIITSGGYSPTLEQSIALARVPVDSGDRCFVDVRKQSVPATIIKPPFVRQGKKQF